VTEGLLNLRHGAPVQLTASPDADAP